MKLVIASAITLLAATAANAATTMIGDTPAIACAQGAAAERPGASISDPARRAALANCNAALADKIQARDVTATLVNRGVLLAAAGNTDAALSDYNAALARDPSLANAYLNRGAAQLRAGRFEQARADFDRALELRTDQPTIAYFSRGMAQEKLGALTAAYRDYRQAQALSPDFKPASNELARFQVTNRVAQN